ncbi:TIGR03560 family F420-dependent LLM class oxidoreductase [Streptomyces sp900105245]|uniref:TIGR03560 family F420-dependent LLM class oxidoreductase n=1 Tax=Streptomyces sp. 900105245 TaxID=3154379 RepID=A0ABV1UMQ7_9ACTN
MDFRVYVEPQLQGVGFNAQREAAQLAEDLGFEGFFRSDHYLADGTGWERPGPTDCWLTLAGIARETRTIRLGSLVSSVTMRLPGPLAIQVSQVDDMSGGRVELGLGAGWHKDEHEAFGVPFPERRFSLLEEQLRIIRGLWSTPTGSTFNFEGAHYRLSGAPALPSTWQQPHPPIIVGGRGRVRTPELAARYADEYNVGMVSPDAAAGFFALVREKCEEVRRPATSLTYSVVLVVCCGTSQTEIGDRAGRMRRGVAELRATGLCGSPAELADKVGRYQDAGATRIYLQFLDITDHDHMELVGHQVITQFS